MTDESFVRWYRATVLGGALAWRLVLFNPLQARGVYDAIEGLVYGVGLGLLPAAALAALAGRMRVRWVLVAVAVTVFAIDVVAFLVARASSSSTAGVVVVLAPLFALATVVPLAAFLGCRARGALSKPAP